MEEKNPDSYDSSKVEDNIQEFKDERTDHDDKVIDMLTN